MTRGKAIVHSDLEELQREAFGYLLHEANPANGPVIDKTAADWPASNAATGLALAAYPVGVERGFMPCDLAVERTLNTLRFFWNSPHRPEPDATGYKARAFTIIFSTCGPDGAPGNASCRQWIALCCWPVR